MVKQLVSFIIPVFNEAKIIRNSIETLVHHLETLDLPFEIIVANDGSTDRTIEESQKVSLKDDRVKVISISNNLGRGEAILVAAKHAKGEVLAFMDADMATDLIHIRDLIYSVLDGSCEIATGSRWVSGAEVKRKFTRKIISFFYNRLVRFLFKSSVHDHQCGFKAFAKPAFMVLSREMSIGNGRSWAWDTECLIRAQRHKFRIREFPVRWKEGKESKFRFVRDSIRVLTYIVKLRYEITYGEVPTPTVIEHFDSIAPSYDLLDITSEKRFSIIAEKISDLVHKQPEHLIILDLGGGTGHLYSTIRNLLDQTRTTYLLLEPSRKMLRCAKTNYKNLQSILAVGEALPFRPGTICCVICSEVLEHVHNPVIILSEIRCALEDDGILIVSNPNKLCAPLEIIAEKINLKPKEGPHRYLTPWKLRRELKINHFAILQEESFIHPKNLSTLDRFFSNNLSRNFALKSIILCRKSDV